MTPTTRKLRILQALETSGPGGAENMVVQLSSALREHGHQVEIATMAEGWMTERARDAGIPVWIVPQSRGIDPTWIRRFARRLRNERIDVLHTHDFEMNVFGGAASRWARVASLSTVHGRHWIAGRRIRPIAYRWLRRLGVPIVAVSEDLARFLVECLGVSRDRLSLVYNGIPLTPSQPRPDRASARAALQIPPDGPLLVAVGNLYPVKDHATLLRAVATLSGVRVAIAGRGEERENLLRLSADLGIADRVHLLGLRNDVDRVLAAGSIFVQPSLSEGLPLALLEAMAAGLPVVATSVGGMVEAVEHGETGLLVPPGDPTELARALQGLLSSEDKLQSMGRAGRERAEADYSVRGMTEQYETLYFSRLANDMFASRRRTA